MTKSIVWLMLFLFATSIFAFIGFIDTVQANMIIPDSVTLPQGYIRSNGTVEPATLPIQCLDNYHYVLKGNIVDYTIEIQKDNISLDGNGFSVSSTHFGEIDSMNRKKTGPTAFQLIDRSNIIIRNLTLVSTFGGIYSKNSSNIIIVQCSITKGGGGISLNNINNFTILGNKLTENSYLGLDIRNSNFGNIAYNDISRNYYYGVQITDASYINITKNGVNNNTWLDRPWIGITLESGNHINISENNFIGNQIGVEYPQNNSFLTDYSNNIYSNYWDNYTPQIQTIFQDGVYIDRSKLVSPTSTDFDPTTFAQLDILSPTPTPIVSPSVSEFSWLTILPILLTIPIAVAIVRKRLQRNI